MLDLDDIIEQIEEKEIVLAEAEGKELVMVFWVNAMMKSMKEHSPVSFYVNEEEYDYIEEAVEAYNQLG